MIIGIKMTYNIIVKTTLVSHLPLSSFYEKQLTHFVKMAQFEQRSNIKFCFKLEKLL